MYTGAQGRYLSKRATAGVNPAIAQINAPGTAG